MCQGIASLSLQVQGSRQGQPHSTSIYLGLHSKRGLGGVEMSQRWYRTRTLKKKYSLFIWNANLNGCPEFTLAKFGIPGVGGGQ